MTPTTALRPSRKTPGELSGPSTKCHSVEEKVNRMEGEGDYTESNDDLDIIGETGKELSRSLDLSHYIEEIRERSPNYASGIIEESEDEDEVREVASRPARPKRNLQGQGEKVSFDSEDEEDRVAAYNEFKNRKSLKRKREAAIRKKERGAVAAPSSIVGKKPKRETLALDEEQRKVKQVNALAEDAPEEEELTDEIMPDYIKSRKRKFERARERLGEAGLKLAPSYDDVDFSDDERMEALQEKPFMKGVVPQRPYHDITMPRSAGIIPAPVAQWLRKYQVEGVEFLHELFVWQRGGILGDDMGLGKTIQVIAFLTAAFGKTGDERDAKRMRKIRRMHDHRWYPKILIVCPGGLMENWKDELEKWGWWELYVCHGNPAEKEAALQAARKGRLEIMITTYTTYRMNKSAINTIDWDCVIADECHQIKSRASEITQAMNEINSLCRIGLTGTAIQNKYEELWTLLNWCSPGRFGSLSTWKHCISNPLKVGQAHDATNEQLSKARKTAELLVKHLLPQFFLRRMKTLIADQLPKKSDRVVFCPLTNTQADAYQNFIDSETMEYIRRSSEDCDCDSGKKRGWCCYVEIPGRGKWQNHVFHAIVTLQKLSNHLALLVPSGSDSADKQSKDLENLQIAVPDQWKDIYRNREPYINFANKSFCGKWKILERLLQFWHASGDKVLVFSHSVRLLKMLRTLFDNTTYNYQYLDGSMGYAQRAETVASFNADPEQFVFLISTRTGGVGLNITSANKVVVFDPNWNPAYDLQAQDRAYRIGQQRDVEVFRLVSAGTIEEIVYARQIYKQQQANIGYTASSERRYFHGVMGEREKRGEIFGLKNMFAFDGESIVLRNIVNNTNVAEVRAGVKVVGIEVEERNAEDEDDLTNNEDETMSQITKLITSGNPDADIDKWRKPKKADPIAGILAGAGVRYTHENSEVIGSSEMEAKLTAAAHERGNDLELGNKPVFDPSQSQDQRLDMELSEVEESDGDDLDGGIRYRYRPPEAVRKRQFCTMAQMFGFQDATEFALAVEGWTQGQRRAFLDRFYRMRREKLFGKADEGAVRLN